MARFNLKNALLPLCLGLIATQATANPIGGFHPKPQNSITPTKFNCGEVNLIFTYVFLHPLTDTMVYD